MSFNRFNCHDNSLLSEASCDGWYFVHDADDLLDVQIEEKPIRNGEEIE
jgi:hypothetical protein